MLILSRLRDHQSLLGFVCSSSLSAGAGFGCGDIIGGSPAAPEAGREGASPKV